MFGTGHGYSDEDIEEMEKAEFNENMDELLPQLDPLFEDDDDKEWAEMIGKEMKAGNLKLDDSQWIF